MSSLLDSLQLHILSQCVGDDACFCLIVNIFNSFKIVKAYKIKGQELSNAALAAPGSPMTALVEEADSIDKVQFMEKLHDARKLVGKITHSQTKRRNAFIVARINKETRSLLFSRIQKQRILLFGKSLSEKVEEAKVMDTVANSIKKQSSYKTQGSVSISGQSLNSNSLLGKRPFRNQSGSQQRYQYPAEQVKRLLFRTKQSFDNSTRYQV